MPLSVKMTKTVLKTLRPGLVALCLTALLPVAAGAQQMVMTTDVPDGISAPDELETRFGTLTFRDGFPTPETTQAVYDQLDFQRALEAALMTTPAASLAAFRNANRERGPDNTSGLLWRRMDSKVLLLTPNTTVNYLFIWLNLKDGPVVAEVPPATLGLINDAWFLYVADLGPAGPDRGEGGKYLILPPDYEGDAPDGYHVIKSSTYGNWFLVRHSDTDVLKQFNMYAWADRDSPGDFQWINVEMEAINTLHKTDFSFFEEINSVVQQEPAESQNPEILGMLNAIGIRKGQPFNPDARMKAILSEAAAVAGAASRVMLYDSRNPEAKVYPNSGWEHPWVGNSSRFENDGVRLLDARTRFHYYATGITPNMVNPAVGKGTQYIAGIRDSEGRPLDGSRTYRVNLPPNVPANNFWAFTLYDVQTRSMLQTDARYPELSSKMDKPVINDDGSYDIYFSPKAPAGQEDNWVQTIPGRGWHMLFRLYGPEQAWFDQTWRPSEIERVD